MFQTRHGGSRVLDGDGRSRRETSEKDVRGVSGGRVPETWTSDETGHVREGL